MYERMNKDGVKIPTLMRYQSFKASNIAGLKLDPSFTGK